MSPNEVNQALCKAFGLDPTQVIEAHIWLRAGRLPEVTIRRHVVMADGITEKIQRLQLRPDGVDLVA